MTNWREKYKKAVTFSYDDSVEQDLKLIDIFNKYGMKCTFNVNTDISPEDSWLYNDCLTVRRLDLEKYASYYAGHEIAVHTLTHPDLTKCTDEEVIREIRGDKENITRIFGEVPVGAAYPYGTYNDFVVKTLDAEGIKYCRGVNETHNFDEQSNLLVFNPTCHHDDEMLFELIEKFLALKPDKPQILYIWGHSYEFEGQGNWDRIEKACELLAGKDDIFYGTNKEVLL